MRNYTKYIGPTIAVILIMTAIVGLYFYVDPTSTPLFPRCPINAITGLQCPGCGSQRAIHALLHADLAAAWRYNPLLPLSIPYLAALLTSQLLRRRSHLMSRIYLLLTSTPAIIIITLIITLRTILANL